MSQADSEHTPSLSRRDVIGGGGKIAAAAAVGVLAHAASGATPFASAPVGAPTHPDARQLAAFERWVALEVALDDLPDDPPEAEFDAACSVVDDAAREIAALAASGAAGLAVKAYMAAHIHFGGRFDDPLAIALPAAGQDEADGRLDNLMHRSLINDVKRWLPILADSRGGLSDG